MNDTQEFVALVVLVGLGVLVLAAGRQTRRYRDPKYWEQRITDSREGLLLWQNIAFLLIGAFIVWLSVIALLYQLANAYFIVAGIIGGMLFVIGFLRNIYHQVKTGRKRIPISELYSLGVSRILSWGVAMPVALLLLAGLAQAAGLESLWKIDSPGEFIALFLLVGTAVALARAVLRTDGIVGRKK